MPLLKLLLNTFYDYFSVAIIYPNSLFQVFALFHSPVLVPVKRVLDEQDQPYLQLESSDMLPYP